jgi:hypothetical protein
MKVFSLSLTSKLNSVTLNNDKSLLKSQINSRPTRHIRRSENSYLEPESRKHLIQPCLINSDRLNIPV